MKALVVFGSKSDKDIYNSLLKELKKHKIESELIIASAHRTPEKINEIADTDAHIIIAGAGLSAALPGAIASKTIKPVIGIPCKGNFQGLDALLSIMQMPSGVPVLAVGINKHEIAANNAAKLAKIYNKINIIGDKENKSVKDALAFLDRFGVSCDFKDAAYPSAINIEFTFFDEPIEKKDELVIYCPLLLEDDDKADAALNILKHTDHGLWVGLNNGKNAALAAIQLLALDNQELVSKLEKYKEDLKKNDSR